MYISTNKKTTREKIGALSLNSVHEVNALGMNRGTILTTKQTRHIIDRV